jgi:hypothetical protein
MALQYYGVLVFIGHKRSRRVERIPAAVEAVSGKAAQMFATRQALEHAGKDFQGEVMAAIVGTYPTFAEAVAAARREAAHV